MADIALAHWGEYVNGGGERVAWDLQRCLDAPLYVSHQDPDMEPDDVDVRELNVGRGLKMMLARGDPFRLLAHQAIWQSPRELVDADVIVTSGNEPLAYVPTDGQTWIAYTHHTSRKATDLYSTIFDEASGRLGPIRTGGHAAVRFFERHIYRSYAKKPDLIVANSDLVAQRVNRYWGVPEDDIRVVYPSVETDVTVSSGGDCYVALSRLTPEKNMVEIAETFGQLGLPLKVAGDGPLADEVSAVARAHENVEYLGYVSDEEKERLLTDAKAFVFAADGEDFGLAPVEAMAAGTPVLGVRDGFTQHQILEGRNGVTFERGELADAVHEFERDGVAWSADDIHEFAEMNFGIERFENEMRAVMQEAVDGNQIVPDFKTPEMLKEAPLNV